MSSAKPGRAEAAFTPGPWDTDGVVVWAGDVPVAVMPSRSHGMEPCPIAPLNGLENADLIAAAPDLYEALRDLLAAYDDPQDDETERAEQARAALAKASPVHPSEPRQDGKEK